MYTFLVILHVFVCLFLILVVLLQTGRGAQMGASFGGSSQAMFGARGQTTFIQKLTAGMAIVFMMLSVALASLSARTSSNLAGDTPKPGKEAGMSKEDKPAAPQGESAAPAPAAPAPAASTAAAAAQPTASAKPAKPAVDTKAPDKSEKPADKKPADTKPTDKPAKP